LREPAEKASRAPGRPVLSAALLAGAQGVGLVVAGVYLIVRALGSDTSHRGSTVVLGILALLVGVGVALMGRATAAGRRRPPLIVLQVICLPVAFTIIQGGRWDIGVPLGASAIAVLVLLALGGLLLPHIE
jgi:hypothetical protein